MSPSVRIIKRIIELGPSGCFQRLRHRIKKHYYHSSIKHKALTHVAHTGWSSLQKLLGAASATHSARQLFMNKTWQEITAHPLFKKHQPELYNSTEQLLAAAQRIVNNEFIIFGCAIELPANNIPWQNDVTIPVRQEQGLTITENYLTEELATTFYAAITIPKTTAQQPNEYASDIKVPWELSRLQHLFVMSKAYNYCLATKDYTTATVYAAWVKNHLADWVTHNPYLLGVNWVCPMDVAIRASNIAWTLHFFAHETTMDELWWQTMLCSLYDHARYLEENWELSDKPNNHYLADLLGYLYLCLVFQQVPYFEQQFRWVLKKIKQQLEQQLLPDGTSYEGSTAYHRLDTEIVLHAALIASANNMPEAPFIQKKLSTMLQFLEHCTSDSGSLITIGDNDSGKIITGIVTSPCKNKTLQSYNNFGLTLVKSPAWHLSFRHAAFSQRQPSGHFHQDSLALTLTNNGIPLLIDPGSYSYTSNPGMRNKLRSWQSHSTFTCTKNIDGLATQDLFQLNRHKEPVRPIITRQENELITLQAFHHEDACKTKKFVRNIRITPITVTLEDSILATAKHVEPCPCSWQFMLHPLITAQQLNDQSWLLCYKNIPVCSLSSSLPLSVAPSFYASEYGILTNTTTLQCTFAITPKQRMYTTFTSY